MCANAPAPYFDLFGFVDYKYLSFFVPGFLLCVVLLICRKRTRTIKIPGDYMGL